MQSVRLMPCSPLSRVRRRRFLAVLAGVTLILCFGCELLGQFAYTNYQRLGPLALLHQDAQTGDEQHADLQSDANSQQLVVNQQPTDETQKQPQEVQKVIENRVVTTAAVAAKVIANGNTKPSRLITITRRFWEGLGNQFFQFSAMYSLGRKYNLQPTLRAEEELLKTFALSSPAVRVISEEDWKAVKWHTVGEVHPCSFSLAASATATLQNDGSNVRLDGYFQSYRYFDEFRSEIVSLFQFSSNVRGLVDEFLKQLRASAPNADALQLVGVHVRRGDIVNDPQVRSGGYQAATAEYLVNASSYFRKRYGAANVRFVVCSDDLQWVHEHFPVGLLSASNGTLLNDTWFMDDMQELNGPPHFLKRSRDMHLLASLDHTIMTVGTFGWWAAYIRAAARNGTTVYYARPFAHGSRIASDFDNSLTDFYPADWLALE